MNLYKSPFLIMCLLASFAAEVHCLVVRKGRGQQSSLAFKATWPKKQLTETADFDWVKKHFYTTIEKFSPKHVIDLTLRP